MKQKKRFCVDSELFLITCFHCQDRLRALKAAQQPDDEGWVTVTRQSKKRKAAKRQSAEQVALQREKRQKKSKRSEIDLKFYAHEKREAKAKG